MLHCVRQTSPELRHKVRMKASTCFCGPSWNLPEDWGSIFLQGASYGICRANARQKTVLGLQGCPNGHGQATLAEGYGVFTLKLELLQLLSQSLHGGWIPVAEYEKVAG